MNTFCSGGVTYATRSSIIKFTVTVTHLNKTIWRRTGRKAFMNTDPCSFGIGANYPSAQALGMVPWSKNLEIASFIMGNMVLPSATKISASMPSSLGDEPFFGF